LCRTIATLLDAARDRSEQGLGYPRFVEREFEKFLACGLLCHGSKSSASRTSINRHRDQGHADRTNE
jgi:hypothetical protein